jgi:hypothetical protein
MPKKCSPALLLPSLEVLRFARLFGPGNVLGDAGDLRAGPVKVAQEQAAEYAENHSERKSDS